MQLKLVLALIFAFVLVLFAVSNREEVPISFFGIWETPATPVVVIILGSIALGALLATFLGWGPHMRLKQELAKKQKRVKEVEEQISQLDLKLRELEEKTEPPEQKE